MPRSRRVVMGVPSLCVRHGQPPQELRDLAILADPGPDDHVPVIGHDAVSEDPERHASGCLFQDALEGGVVFLLQEKSGARIGAVQYVIDVTALDRTGASWHGVSVR